MCIRDSHTDRVSRESHLLRSDVAQGIAIARVRRIEIDEAADPLARTIRHAGDDHAPVTVSGEYDVAQVLVYERLHDIIDMHIEIDCRADEVGALAQARERRRVDHVTGRLHAPRHLLIAPAAVSPAVDQYECCHCRLSRSVG